MPELRLSLFSERSPSEGKEETNWKWRRSRGKAEATRGAVVSDLEGLNLIYPDFCLKKS